MEKKIDIAKILKDCPRGMELDCTMFRNLEFEYIDEGDPNYPIVCRVKCSEGGYNRHVFTEHGCYNKFEYSECVIFPKDKKTWEGFQRPFKDGDILVHTQNKRLIISIYHNKVSEFLIKTHCILWDKDEGLSINKEICCYNDYVRFATEGEKQKLFDVIKENGYKWNAKTLTLEKLLKPKFKIGDKVRKIGDYISGKVVDFDKDYFYKIEYNSGCVSYVNINAQDDWELFPTRKFKVGDRIRSKTTGWEFIIVEIKDDLKVIVKSPNNTLTKYPNTFSYFNFYDTSDFELVPNKFNITTLKPFESRVLVRDKNIDEWRGHFFSHYDNKSDRPYICIGVEGVSEYKQCVPYEGNEHLLGTTKDCNEYYKTWE